MSEDIAVHPGDIVAGKYRVEEVLGKGQMGVIVAATHLGLDRRYAIKLIAHRSAGPEHRERFLREARAAVKLESQHVARVFDVGTLDDGAPYMVMELLKGRDLAAVLHDRGPLPIPEAVEYILQACEAIGEAHRAGIVHRDIKPANLFLTAGPGSEPCVKILDFGVSKMSEREGNAGSGLKLTQDQQLLGSPLYMSPEQLFGSKDVDAQSDIWALGVTLYELCTGALPFVAENLIGLTTAVVTKPPVPLSRHRPDAPPTFEAVVLSCFEKERDRRWPNVAALANALVPFAPARAARYAERIADMLGEQVEPARPTTELRFAPEETEPPVAQPPMAGSTSAIISTPPALPAPRRRRIFAPVGVGLAVLGVAAFGLMRWRASSEPAHGAGGTVAPVQPSVIVLDASDAAPPLAPSVTVSAIQVIPATADPPTAAAPSASVTASAPVPRPRLHPATPRPAPAAPKPDTNQGIYTR